MAKVKLTKTELKRQRDQLKQFTRYLPTLQLKKQQLQMEVRRVNEQIAGLDAEAEQFKRDIEAWIGLCNLQDFALANELVGVSKVKVSQANIAGVEVPMLEDVQYEVHTYDLFSTPSWLDAAVDAVKRLLSMQIRRRVLEKQRDLLEEELITTTQRVNLFEKVKIPECRSNIRQIQIYLGDQQTAAVGRAKIAKSKLTSADATA